MVSISHNQVCQQKIPLKADNHAKKDPLAHFGMVGIEFWFFF